MLLLNNLGIGASAWIDDIIIEPQVQSIICNQPFLLDSENLPSTLNFSVQFMNGTINPIIGVNSFTVKLDEQVLTVKTVVHNETTQLYDITANLPALQNGKYILKISYGSQESLNFKGVNVYQYTGNFSFIHWTDIHYNIPIIGFENQLNTTIQLLMKADPDFIIMTGDIASSGANYQRFCSIMKDMGFKIPIFFASGNHEKESLDSLKNAILYMGENKTTFNNEYPFSFNYGSYHFIGLDSGVFPYESAGNISDTQFNWLKTELINNQDKHLISFCHHPLYMRSTNDFWLNSSIAQNVMKLFSTYGVSTVLAGHAHRSDVSNLNGVTYYTTVSGHNDTHWLGPEPYPPAGFRIIKVINSVVTSAEITDTFSYYTGELVYASASPFYSSKFEP